MSRRRVLIADREPDVADTLATVLTLHGLEAVAVYTGSDALDVISRDSPDASVLGLDLPGVDDRRLGPGQRFGPGRGLGPRRCRLGLGGSLKGGGEHAGVLSLELGLGRDGPRACVSAGLGSGGIVRFR